MVIKMTGFPASTVKLGTWQVQCCAGIVGKMRSVEKKSEHSVYGSTLNKQDKDQEV
jgi:cytochrome oxidase assembly protein ShyY1